MLFYRYCRLAVLSLFTAGAVACSDGGGGDEPKPEGPLTFTVDKKTITANGEDEVTFTVKQGDADVTSAATITMTSSNGKTVRSRLTTNKWGSKINGEFIFSARYNNKTAGDQITITASNRPEETFYRKIAIMQVTSTGCTNCPAMTPILDQLQTEFPDRLLRASYHMQYGSGPTAADPMTIPDSKNFASTYGIEGLPNIILDQRIETVRTSIIGLIRLDIRKSFKDFPASCGVAFTTKLENNTIHVDTKVKASMKGQYRVAVYVLEDGIVATQDNNGVFDAEYVHNHVVRAQLAGGFTGDDLGVIGIDEEKSKSFQIGVENSWNTEKITILVCVLDNPDGSGFIVNNSNACALGESVDYKYNE